MKRYQEPTQHTLNKKKMYVYFPIFSFLLSSHLDVCVSLTGAVFVAYVRYIENYKR